MKKEMIIQAVDIGTTKVAAIVARKTPNNKLEILGIGTAPSFGVRRADVTNINRATTAVKIAVEQAEKQSGIKFDEVYVGVAGSHVKCLQHRGVKMRADYEETISEAELNELKQDMYKLALPPGDQIIDILPQGYMVDSEYDIDPVGMTGSKIEGNYHIITGSANHIRNIERCISDAGLRVKQVIMQPLASAAAVLSDDEKKAGVVLVDIGGGTTDIAIFVEGVIGFTSVIPFGGEIVTEDLRAGCHIMKEQAERLKVIHGAAYPEDSDQNKVISIPGVHGRSAKEISAYTLSSIIQARMEEILTYVSSQIELSNLQDRLLGGLVLTGGGSRLKHIKQLTEYETGMEARLGFPNEHLASTNVRDVDNPSYATGIGLILMAIERGDNQQAPVQKPQIVVEKPTNVDNNGEEERPKPVDLDNITKPTKPNKEDVGQSATGTKKGSKITETFKVWKNRLTQWMEDDLSDFEESNHNSINQKK